MDQSDPESHVKGLHHHTERRQMLAVFIAVETAEAQQPLWLNRNGCNMIFSCSRSIQGTEKSFYKQFGLSFSGFLRTAGELQVD